MVYQCFTVMIFFFFFWSPGTRMDTTYLSNLKNKQTNLKPQMVLGKVPPATLEGLSSLFKWRDAPKNYIAKIISIACMCRAALSAFSVCGSGGQTAVHSSCCPHLPLIMAIIHSRALEVTGVVFVHRTLLFILYHPLGCELWQTDSKTSLFFVYEM